MDMQKRSEWERREMATHAKEMGAKLGPEKRHGTHTHSPKPGFTHIIHNFEKWVPTKSNKDHNPENAHTLDAHNKTLHLSTVEQLKSTINKNQGKVEQYSPLHRRRRGDPIPQTTSALESWGDRPDPIDMIMAI